MYIVKGEIRGLRVNNMTLRKDLDYPQLFLVVRGDSNV